jgi:hypothetical protein
MLFEKRRHMATTSELWICRAALGRYLRVYATKCRWGWVDGHCHSFATT